MIFTVKSPNKRKIEHVIGPGGGTIAIIPGYLDVRDEDLCDQLIALGYEVVLQVDKSIKVPVYVPERLLEPAPKQAENASTLSQDGSESEPGTPGAVPESDDPLDKIAPVTPKKKKR